MSLKKNKTIIVAEAGVNHNGDPETAKRLVDVADSAGADLIKFQTFKASSLVTQKAPKASYQRTATDINESQFEMLSKLEALSAHLSANLKLLSSR